VPYRGVIFDLYGTLIDGWSSAEADQRAAELGAALGVPPDPLGALLRTTYTERATGVLGDTAQTLRELCRRIGEHPSDERLEGAAALRVEQFREVLSAPRPETSSFLATVRDRGFRLGLVSDCSSETPEIWPSLPWAAPIEAPVFSWSEGRRKPDPHLYHLALARLGLESSECVYVGDGGSRELSGAEAVGMRAFKVVYRPSSQEQHLQYDPDLDWRGPELSLLSDLLPLLGRVERLGSFAGLRSSSRGGIWK
jgi:putative hydrolase of the HAD superfamily